MSKVKSITNLFFMILHVTKSRSHLLLRLYIVFTCHYTVILTAFTRKNPTNVIIYKGLDCYAFARNDDYVILNLFQNLNWKLKDPELTSGWLFINFFTFFQNYRIFKVFIVLVTHINITLWRNFYYSVSNSLY